MTDDTSAPRQPFIVGIGGTSRASSSTETAIAIALRKAEALGARTALIGGGALNLPMYEPDVADRSAEAVALVEQVRRADGLIIGSPGYHCGISGMVKNALDYIQDLSDDPSPYLNGRAVGLIATGAGWQGAVLTLSALRTVVHALRGWPSPLGVPVNTIERPFDGRGVCTDARLEGQLEILASEVMDFALHRGTAAHRRTS